MFFSLSSVLLALATSTTVFALATPTVTSRQSPKRSLNPPKDVLRQGLRPAISQRGARSTYLTNGQRLAAGLKLNPPKRRMKSKTVAARATPSGAPGTAGYLEVTDSQNGAFIGYVRNSWNEFGEFGPTEDVNERLTVVVDLLAATSGAVNILTTNGPNVLYPYFGGVNGFNADSDNLSAGSSDYAYLAGTTFTDRLSPPVAGVNAFTGATGLSENIESSIFRYNPVSQAITPQWINTDGSSPNTLIGLTQGVLVMTGDSDVFIETFGPTQWITLRFVPA